MPRPPLRHLLSLLLGATALGWGAIRGWDAWQYHDALTRAERDVSAGKFAEARDRLVPLARRWPGRGEVEYQLGTCEAALGHVEPALAAWGRVPAGSVLAPRAALERAKLSLAHGRLEVAEESLAPIEESRGPLGEEAARLAQQLDLFSGRAYRIPRRIERRWDSARDRANLLRTHWRYETQPFPVREVGDALERMNREAPRDDRVWLGLADVAARTGRFEDADRWLTACEARRHGDPDVRHARLQWAVEARRTDVAAATLGDLPASRYTPAELASLAARLAALRGDLAAERRAWERRVELEPGDASAWVRLADLAIRAPGADRGLLGRAKRREAEIDRASDAYRKLMVDIGDLARTAELARLAEALGRRFEARGWWTLRVLRAPDDAEARAALDRLPRSAPGAGPVGPTGGPTLADLIPMAAEEGRTPGATAAHAGGAVAFRDDAEASGLRFRYEKGATRLHQLPETMAGGIGLIDFDADGWLDVYAVQGGRFPPGPGEPSTGGDRLFRNKGDGTFEDFSDRSGIASFRRGYGHGVAVGDIDSDGHADLFITRWQSYALYRNEGDGTFEDATERLGLGGSRDWPTSSAFADLDNDGDLDLYVCHYLAWDAEHPTLCRRATVSAASGRDDPGHEYDHCPPRAFPALADHLFRNDGDRFVDVSEEAGIAAGDRDGRGLGVVAADLDGDGKVDLFVANDMTPNLLFRNLGGMKFEEIGIASGAGSNAGGGYQAGMGIACGDLDGDGRPDLAVTNFHGESVTLFQNLGNDLFIDRTASAGLAAPTRFMLGFGTSPLYDPGQPFRERGADSPSISS